jgi:UDP-N-acetylmuramoylalanine--D-glutamate ligase
MAAICAALLFGVPPAAIRAAAAAFEGVEHRLEPVAVIDGVRFINDSQGMQPDALAAALRAFEPPIVLIAGGRAKGLDLDALASVVAERAVAAVLIGESGPDLEASFRGAGLARTERATDIDDAVRRADAIARQALAAGDRGAGAAAGTGATRSAGPATVLLSPAAASFDMFVDYAARGRAFKAAVAALAAERGRGGER